MLLSQEADGADPSSPLLVSMPDSLHHHHLSSAGHHHLSSVGKAFGNIIISIVGAGVLGLPYTFKRTGWVLSVLVLATVGLACYYCMMLLVWSRKRLEKDGDHHVATFSDLGFLLYGKWGRFAVDSMVVLSQGAFCVAYLIFIGENLASVFSSQGNNTLSTRSNPYPTVTVREKAVVHHDLMQSLPVFKRFLAETMHEVSRLGGFFSSKEGYISVIFPLQVALASIRSLTKLAPFSITADFANAFAMAVVMQQDVMMLTENGIATIAASQGLGTLPFAIGVAIYAFEGFGLVLPLESSMKDTEKFGRVLGLAMVCITLLYMVFGLLGYLAFGDETLDIVTLNLGSSWKTTIVKASLCVGLFFTFPVMMHPVYEVVERRLVRERPSMILRSTIVLGAAWCAVAVPQFGDFLSLIGNSVCCMLAFVLPALFHMKAHREDVSKTVLGLDYLFIGFGLLYGIWGTVSALQNILAT